MEELTSSALTADKLMSAVAAAGELAQTRYTLQFLERSYD